MTKLTRSCLFFPFFILLNPMVYGGGYSLYTENSPAAIGNFAAGIAAEATDASVGWYNPAALILLNKQEFVIGAVGVFPSSSLTGSSTFTTVVSPFLPPLTYTQQFQNLQDGKNGVIPSLHYAQPLGNNSAFSINLVAPVGLSSSYGDTAPVRYSGTYSNFETFNLSPAFATQFSDFFSVGAGLDLQYASIKLNGMLGSPAELNAAGLPPTLFDSEVSNSGDSFGAGYHVGILLKTADNHSRIGVNYESAISHNFKGKSRLEGPLADPLLNVAFPLTANGSSVFRTNSFRTDTITFPDLVTLSGYQDIGSKFALLGSVVYTGWSKISDITLRNVAAGIPDPLDGFVDQVLVSTVDPQNYVNTWRYVIGANYHINDRWMFRCGTGYDQTPTVNSAREVRLADADRWAFAVGSHFQFRENLGFDLGYSYVMGMNKPSINRTEQVGTTSTFNVNARAKDHGSLVGLQAVWSLDKSPSAPMKN